MNEKPPDDSKKLRITSEVWLFLFAGIAATVFTIWRNFDVFPAALIDISRSRVEAVDIAKKYADESGYGKPSEVSSNFSYDHDASTFLQYEMGAMKARELMKNEVPIWHWRVEFQKEDASAEASEDDVFSAEIGTDGQLHYFDQFVADEEGMYSVSHEKAKEMAVEFAVKTYKADVSKWKLIADSKSKMPNRNDHAFTWEDQSKDLAGGRMRIYVRLSGNVITSSERFLQIPEKFTDKFAALRAQNEVFSDCATIFMSVFLCILPFIFIQGWVKHDLRIRFALTCGALAALINLLTSINDLATSFSSYIQFSNLTDWVATAGHELLLALAEASLYGVSAIVFAGAIELSYRKMMPKEVALEKLFFSLDGLRSRNILNASVIGIALTAICFAYQILFYMLGKPLGFYVPLSINDSQALSSFCPAWDAISVGLAAAFAEELGFRVFLLSFLQKWTRSFWLANVLQAVIWGFAHCNYAVEPPFARGFELSTSGLVAGCVMRRYGIVPLLICHYGFDAIITIMPFLCSESSGDKLSASATFIPLIALPLASLLAIKSRGLVDQETVANSSIPSPETQETTVVSTTLPSYIPLSSRTMLGLTFATVLSIALLLMPYKHVDSKEVLRIDRQKAVSISKDYFEKQKLNLKGWMKVTWLETEEDTNELQYLYEHTGFERTRQLARSIGHRVWWNVSWFKPGDPEVFTLEISPDGKPITSRLSLSETSPGAKLNQEEAQNLAESHLRKTDNKMSQYIEMRDVTKTEHSDRTDYHFSAEIPSLKVKDADFRINVDVLGNQISEMDHFWHLPAKWLEQREKETPFQKIVGVVQIAALAVFGINFAYWMLQMLRKRQINWHLAAAVATIAGIIELTLQFNDISIHAFLDYSTMTPVSAHLLKVALNTLASLLVQIFILGLSAALFSAVYSEIIAGRNLRNLLTLARQFLNRKNFLRDSIILGYVMSAAVTSIRYCCTATLTMVSPEVPVLSHSYLCEVEQLSPALACIAQALQDGVIAFIGTGLALRWKDFFKLEFIHGLMIVTLFSAMLNATALYSQDLIIQVFIMAANFAVAYAIIIPIGRNNLLCCFFSGFLMELSLGCFKLWRGAGPIHSPDAILLTCLYFLPLTFVIASILKERLVKKGEANG